MRSSRVLCLTNADADGRMVLTGAAAVELFAIGDVVVELELVVVVEIVVVALFVMAAVVLAGVCFDVSRAGRWTDRIWADGLRVGCRGWRQDRR